MTRPGIVVGAGPAGLALARALTDGGVPVLCVDPRAGRPWRTTWGLWRDEVDALDLHACVAAGADAPCIRLHSDERLVLRRGYAVLDPERLRQHLMPRTAAPFAVERGSATVVAEDHVVIDGARVDARFVVDCRGGARAPRCAQTALGAFVRGVHEPVLMDFSLAHDDDDPRPSFGYVVPIGGGRTLVEETSLCASPPMTRATLSQRLARRLASMNVRADADRNRDRDRDRHRDRDRDDDDDAREWVSIPLDGLPATVAVHGDGAGAAQFGVRGGVVHPATGYALARTLADAPRVADAICGALARDARPTQIARAAHDAAWPTTRRLSYAAFRFGRDVLLQLDLAEQRTFFRAFFSLAERDQRAFLTSSSSPRHVLGAMGHMWPRLSWPVRAKILGALAVVGGAP